MQCQINNLQENIMLQEKIRLCPRWKKGSGSLMFSRVILLFIQSSILFPFQLSIFLQFFQNFHFSQISNFLSNFPPNFQIFQVFWNFSNFFISPIFFPNFDIYFPNLDFFFPNFQFFVQIYNFFTKLSNFWLLFFQISKFYFQIIYKFQIFLNFQFFVSKFLNLF